MPYMLHDQRASFIRFLSARDCAVIWQLGFFIASAEVFPPHTEKALRTEIRKFCWNIIRFFFLKCVLKNLICFKVFTHKLKESTASFLFIIHPPFVACFFNLIRVAFIFYFICWYQWIFFFFFAASGLSNKRSIVLSWNTLDEYSRMLYTQLYYGGFSFL